MDRVATNALIVEGGAMRAVFSCGILDHFLSADFSPFDSFWGVSAGASNVAAFLANMPGRNLKIYTDYSCRKEFIRLSSLFSNQDIMNLDWLWDITVKELGLDTTTMEKDGRPFYLAVTNQQTGLAEYLLAEPETVIETMKASSALPILYKHGVKLANGHHYVDGGVADAIPVAEAIRRGATNIMVLRSRPLSYQKSASKMPYMMKKMLAKTPQLIEPMLQRSDNYNHTLELIRNPPEGVNIVEICPPESFQLKRLTRDPKPLLEGYHLGKEAAVEAIARWKKETSS
ncbi:patatin family protein [Vibrio sp. MACH09]|uniref:patatin-like phospholipase family protein n=1 Tax=Vibrio sp. MACH09 TaxID=3025122 RepID=UPI002791B33A|nr:patatin family protein [Vibrio sp. MACH09]GLO63224.1 patatin family protein [Vibrio sp. MACH09]